MAKKIITGINLNGKNLHFYFLEDKLMMLEINSNPAPPPDGWLRNPNDGGLDSIANSITEMDELLRSLTGITDDVMLIDGILISGTPLKVMSLELHLPDILIFTNFIISPIPDTWVEVKMGLITVGYFTIVSDFEEMLERFADNPF